MATKKIKLPKDLQGNEYYPATTTDAVVHPERKESVTVIVDTLATEVNELKSDLIENDEKINEIDRNKVDRDDNAPKLTAGFANNLVGRGDATKEEISFRPSGGDTSIEDGTARIDRVKGSTVVWNQLLKCEFTNGETYGGTVKPTVQDGKGYLTFTANGDSFTTSFIATKNHYYLWEARLSATTGCRLFMHSFGALTTLSASTDMEVVQGIVQYKSDSVSRSVMLLPLSGITEPTDIVVDYYRLYDLTQMFGWGNEPTTVEEFHARKPLGIDEYAYNEGELISTNVEELKSVGFNLFNGVLERGRLTNGAPTASNNMMYSPEYYRILPNAQMYARIDKYNDNPVYFYPSFYDSQKNFISAFENIYAKVFTTPSNAAYLRFFIYENKGNVLPLDYGQHVCIHLVHTGYRNGEYEPYKEFRRSIPIKDIKDGEGNQLFPYGLLSAGSAYDEITATKAIKRIGVVDMGTLKWSLYSTTVPIFRILSAEVDRLNMARNPNTRAPSNMICDLYQPAPTYSLDGEDKMMRGPFDTSFYNGDFHIRNNSYTDADTFKAAMSGVMLYYELAEPIEVDLEEPLNFDYEAWDFGTEEIIHSEPTTPMKADIIYQFNAVDRIRDNSRHTAEAEIKLKDYETRIAALEAMIANLTREGDEVLE